MNEIAPDRQDFEIRDVTQAQWLKCRPICICCGEHIQDDSAVQIKCSLKNIRRKTTCQ